MFFFQSNDDVDNSDDDDDYDYDDDGGGGGGGHGDEDESHRSDYFEVQCRTPDGISKNELKRESDFYRTQVYLGSDLWVRVSLSH